MVDLQVPMRKSVLIVEDEPIIRMFAMEMLADAGYTVFAAANADEAVDILESRTDISVVFADIDMPGSLDGMKLASCIRDRWPPIEIILTSGKCRPRAADLPARTVFIPKPYQFAKVTDALRMLTR